MKFAKIPGKDFEMSIYQTTQHDWVRQMGKNPSYFKGKKGIPVECVSWNEVQEFIKKLNSTNDTYIYRLPTEQEWEYCCRAGSTTDFNFGDNEKNLPDYAWFYENSENKTHPVGQKKPNSFGLYDMHGNVWEWTESLLSAEISCRVIRGGSWDDFAQNARSADRSYNSPGNSNYIVGFRLVRTAYTPVPSNTLTIEYFKNSLWIAYRAKARREFLRLWKDIK